MDMNLLNNKMQNAITFYEKELISIRTSRANPSMLDNLLVDAYGSKTPINQLGNINVPDANTLTIQVWDTSLLKNIENTIMDSKLGINPQSDGGLIRLPIPKLSEERRNELSKVVSQYAENAKISVRNIRRETLEILKKNEKDKNISQDDLKKDSIIVQKKTDEFIAIIDKLAVLKIIDITKV